MGGVDVREISGTESTEAARAPITAVVVTFNSAKVIPGLLDSLEQGFAGVEDWEIVIADNQSTDDSVAIARSHPARPRLLETGRNGGYSAAINAVADTVPAHRSILVLNPDIRLTRGSVVALRQGLADPRVGIAVPRIVDEDGHLALSLRRMPSVVTAWSEALLGGRISEHLGLSERIADPRVYRQGGSVEWATGAAFLITPEARARVGAWDESFFLYSEEVDYCARVRSAGLRIDYVPDSQMVHIGGDYAQRPWLSALLTLNRVRYYRRHHGTLNAALFQAAIVTGKMIRSPIGATHRAAFWAALRPSSYPDVPGPPAAPRRGR
jgi:N-acetylglucosaminyl-diphospho-decaprenol L-rhamnosyltransferase